MLSYNYLIDFSNYYDYLKENDADGLCYPGTNFLSSASNPNHLVIAFDDDTGEIVSDSTEIKLEKKNDFLIYGTEESFGRTCGIAPYYLEDYVYYVLLDDYRKELISNVEHFYKVTGLKGVGYVLDALKDGRIASAIKSAYPDWESGKYDRYFVSYVLRQKNGVEEYLRDDPTLIEKWVAYTLSDDYLEKKYHKKGFCQSSGERCVVSLNQNNPKVKFGGGGRLICDNDQRLLYKGERYKMGYDSFHASKSVILKAHAALQWLIRNRSFYIDKNEICFFWKEREEELIKDCMGFLDSSDLAVCSYEKVKEFIKNQRCKESDDENIYMASLMSPNGTGAFSFVRYEKLSTSLLLNGMENWYEAFSEERDGYKRTKMSIRYFINRCFFNDKQVKKLHRDLLGFVMKNQKISNNFFDMFVLRMIRNKKEFVFYNDLLKRLMKYNQLVEISRNKMCQKGVIEMEEKTSYDFLCGRLFSIMEKMEEKSASNYATKNVSAFLKEPFGLWNNFMIKRIPILKKKIETGIYFWLMKKSQEIINLINELDYDVSSPIKSNEWILGYNYQKEKGYVRKVETNEEQESTEEIIEEDI